MKLMMTTTAAIALLATAASAEAVKAEILTVSDSVSATDDDENASRGARNTTGAEALGNDNQNEIETDKTESVELPDLPTGDTEDDLDRSRSAGNETGSETFGIDNQAEGSSATGDSSDDTVALSDGDTEDDVNRSRGAGNKTGSELTADDNQQENSSM